MTALSEGEKRLVVKALRFVADRQWSDFTDDERTEMRRLVRDRLTPSDHRTPWRPR